MAQFLPALIPAQDTNCNPIVGATWTFYLSGTSTTTRVFSDPELSVSAGTSVTSEAGGRFDNIYYDDSVSTRAVLRDNLGATIRNIDPVEGGGSAALSVSFESLGATGTPGVNDQAAMQAAVTYAVANGIPKVIGTSAAYEVWTPTRTTLAYGYETDGSPLYIPSTATRLEIDFGGATIDLRGPSGSTSRGTGQPTQNWAGDGSKPWLGGFIYIVGSDTLKKITIKNATVNGNFTCADWLNNTNRNLTDKCIRIQDHHCDLLELENLYCHHFGAEIYYLAGSKTGGGTPCNYKARNVKGEYSPQSIWNPSANGVVDAEGLECNYSYASAEILGGLGSVYKNCRFQYSGQLGAFGGAGDTILYNYGFPSRGTTIGPPWLDMIDCEFNDTGFVSCPNYTRILGFRAVDTYFSIVAALVGSARAVRLEGEITLDRKSLTGAIELTGPSSTTTAVPGAGAGIYIADVADIRAEIKVHRTELAKTNNRKTAGFQITGRFAADTNILTLIEGDGVEKVASFGGTVVNMPLVVQQTATTSHTIGAGRANGATSVDCAGAALALSVTSPSMMVNNSGGAGAYAITIGAGSGYEQGQRLRINYDPYSTGGTTYTFAKNGTGLRLNADAILAVRTDYLLLEYDDAVGVWTEVSRTIKA